MLEIGGCGGRTGRPIEPWNLLLDLRSLATMNGYSRLGNGRPKEGNFPVSTVTKTPSPPSSPRFRHGRNKNNGCGSRGPKLQKLGEWLAYISLSAVLWRRGILLFAPLVYISGMLMYMGSLSLEIIPTAVVVDQPPPPGSIYRCPQVFEKLWPFMQADGDLSSIRSPSSIFSLP